MMQAQLPDRLGNTGAEFLHMPFVRGVRQNDELFTRGAIYPGRHVAGAFQTAANRPGDLAQARIGRVAPKHFPVFLEIVEREYDQCQTGFITFRDGPVVVEYVPERPSVQQAGHRVLA